MDEGLPRVIDGERQTVRDWSQEREFGTLLTKATSAIQNATRADLIATVAWEIDDTWTQGNISLDQRNYLFERIGRKPR